jgi:Flp pilus assembly protein TadG
MTSKTRPQQQGQALLEFTLAAIPLIFLLISIVEMSRGMWVYVTLAHAIKEGTRFSVVHGADCVQADTTCQISVSQVAARIITAGMGLDASKMNVVLQTAGASQTCAPVKSCLDVGTAWPPAPDNSVGLPITMSATYPFRTGMAMFIPRAGSVNFGAINFGATSQQEITY